MKFLFCSKGLTVLAEEQSVPGWSTEIANELIRMAAASGRPLNQLQLQELVYIAHGWCLALTGQPLTGDRPEALEHGPEYRRLAQAFERSGTDPVTREIEIVKPDQIQSETESILQDARVLSRQEIAILERTYAEYASLEVSRLATITRAEGTPWHTVFAEGAGKRRDIAHGMIRAQFAEIAGKLDRKAEPD
jgi:uncharacterized phage-associated protein